ncbi:MAG: GGDEF domain-containing protein [Clostridiales Family XIII bacterium]|nr:GGDEF domain-containing protein [Clostridiales Family XIII bacterium]
MNENLRAALSMIAEQFEEGGIVCFALFAIVAILTIVYLLRGIYIMKKRSVESFNFLLFCIPVLVWSVLTDLAPTMGFDPADDLWFGIVTVAASLLIPPFLMLHVQSQVSYHPVTAALRIAWLIVPIILIAFWTIRIAYPDINVEFFFGERISLYSLISTVYFIVVTVRSYLLCFNVFYQMPKHMRRSTYQLLVAISATAVAYGVNAYLKLGHNAGNILLAFALIVVLQTLFTAFFIANSSNVIVTSRDFVFSSLSTIVLTVSLKGNILDWNKKERDGCAPLPGPLYKEPYQLYRKRILDTYNGIVSKYDENIITVKTEGVENHLLFTWHDIGFKERHFGYLVEIADITKSYQKIRYFEEIALYDNLTGLRNRNAYIEEVKQISAAGNMPLCIIIGDVNNLKRTNDLIGHLEGDRLLRVIADAVRDGAPKNAFVARIGGDEIAILVRNAEADAAETLTRTVDAALSQINDNAFGVPSISWGWAVMHQPSEDYNSLFREADAIMYESKRRMKEVSLSGIVPDRQS